MSRPAEAQSAVGGYKVSHGDLHTPIQFLADCVVIVAASLVIGGGYLTAVRGGVSQPINLVGMGLVIALFYGCLERIGAGHRAFVLTTRMDRVMNVAQYWTTSFGVLIFVLFALKAGNGFSRGAVISFFVLGLPAFALWRVQVSPLIARSARKVGHAERECIVVGGIGDSRLDKFVANLRDSGARVPTIIRCNGHCDLALWASEHKHIVASIIDAAGNLDSGDIYLCAGAIPYDRLLAIGRAVKILPRAIFVVPDAQTSTLLRSRSIVVGDNLAVELREEPLGRAQQVVKRAMDIAIATVALALFSPFMVLIALAIKLDSEGPVFFTQTRNGYRGQPFKLIKFRSMYVQEDGAVIPQARRNDPRVTRVGEFIRKTSLDELPQLFNILSGEMSLVGPRPHAVAHDEIYARSIENYEVRQHVKPGLTGWAQVNGMRGETATLDLMFRRIDYDLWYAAHASILLDCEILARTLFVAWRQPNAY